MPQPITPPPVVTAGSLPSESTPLLAPVAEEAEPESSTAAASAAAAAAEAAPATPAPPAPLPVASQPSPPPQPPAQHPMLDAALVHAIARSEAPFGPPSLEAAVDQWEADVVAHAGAERRVGAGPVGRPAGAAGLPPARRRLEDLKVGIFD